MNGFLDYLVNNLVSDDLGNILDKLVIFGTKRRYQSIEEVLKDLSPNSTTSVQTPFTIQPKVTKPIPVPIQPAVTKTVPTIIQPVQAEIPKNIIVPKIIGTYTEILTKKTITVRGFFWGKTEVVSLEEIELEMVILPAGSFTIGSDEDDSEKPKHQVTLKQFAIAKYPVTQEQYQAVMESNPSKFKDNSKNPVEKVNWNDAQAFCQKINQKTGKKYRLPSEAEWEYACRAGTKTSFYFGETISTDQANYNGNYIFGKGKKGVYREKTTPVGSFSANKFGLYDLHGNVWEWCEDGWHENYQNAPKDGSSWNENHSQSSVRVLRGGSWSLNSGSCRSAGRGRNLADVGYYFGIGFRLAVSIF